jgi:hypothetical protein
MAGMKMISYIDAEFRRAQRDVAEQILQATAPLPIIVHEIVELDLRVERLEKKCPTP